MEFFEDPFGFDVMEAKARKKITEQSADIEASAINNEDDGLLKKTKGKSPMLIVLPNSALDARIEESFKNVAGI